MNDNSEVGNEFRGNVLQILCFRGIMELFAQQKSALQKNDKMENWKKSACPQKNAQIRKRICASCALLTA